MKPTISACMIVKNEEDCLERCLKSVRPFVDEIVLCDTGSEDKTKEIAARYDCAIYDHPWEQDFSKARNQAFSHATKDWCFIIDADEEFKPTEYQKVYETIAKNTGEVGQPDCYFLRVRNIMPTSGNFSDMPSIRLVRNKMGAYYTSVVHNQMVNYGKYDNIPAIVLHYGYDGITKKKKDTKINRTLNLLEGSLAKDPDNIFHMFNMARHFNFMQDWENGRAWCLKCIQKLQENPKIFQTVTTYSSIYFSLFISCFNQRDYWTPIGHFEFINGILPDYIDGHFGLGVCHAFNKDVRKAENELLSQYVRLLERYDKGEINTHAELWSISMEPYAYFYLGLMFHRLQMGGFGNHWMDKASRFGHKTVSKLMAEGGFAHAPVQN